MVQHLSKIAYFRSENSRTHGRLDEVKKAISENKGVSYDPEIMPKCFSESSAEQIASFYSYVFNVNSRTIYAFRGVSAVLQQLDNGLQFIV
jgi:adenylate kinase family enzyme